MAQSSPPPTVRSANNSADYTTTIAQGSLFVVFGYNLGPANLVQVSAFPLPNTLAGTSVTVSSGPTTLNCPMIYTSAGQVAAILPSDTPVGTVTITVTYQNVTAPGGNSTTQATVVANSVGIYTLGSSGVGNGSFTDLAGNLITYSNAAKPGQDVYLWGTGMGPIDTPDNVLPPSFPNFPNVQVWVGGQSASIIYGGRSGCCAGVDQIVFTIPNIASGCNVPVTVVSGGSSSNTVTLPVSPAGGACQDTGPTLPTSVLSKAAAGQTIKAAAIGIGPLGLAYKSDSVSNNAASSNAVAKILSDALHTQVPPEDAALLTRAFASRNQSAIRRALSKYAARWKSLNARTRARIAAQVSQAQDGAIAIFGSLTNEGPVAMVAGALLPAAGACIVSPTALPHSPGTVHASLDAGPSLSLSGPGGAFTLAEKSRGNYQMLFGPASTGQAVPLGTYTISGQGGQDVGPFSGTITIGSHLAISNASALSTIDRTQPLVINWTGGTSGQYILIGGYSPAVEASADPTAFACVADGGAGTFTVPAYILASINPSGPGKGGLLLAPHPLDTQITVPGLDLVYFLDGSSATESVTFQ
jgi:uncharacterized protein (TIGR03437 family)